jgi:hypothetical protein
MTPSMTPTPSSGPPCRPRFDPTRTFGYWYYRRRVIEARHWLEDVLATMDAPATGGANSVEATMARLALAGVNLLTERVDQAVSEIDAALHSLDRIPADLLVEVGETLVSVADAGWAKNEFSIVVRVSAALNEIGVISGDPLLLLMADKVDCESGLPTRDLVVTAARAEELYERGKSIGNSSSNGSMWNPADRLCARR